MEAEVISEVGAWKNFDDLEEYLTVDELFLLYENSMERQRRTLQALGVAMGASPLGGGEGIPTERMDVNEGPVRSETGDVMFAYFQEKKEFIPGG